LTPFNAHVWRELLFEDGRVEINALLFGLALSGRLNSHGRTSVLGRAELARRMRRSEPTARRASRRLVEFGYLEITKGGGTRANTYQALLPLKDDS
jgi:hypothetical protein